MNSTEQNQTNTQAIRQAAWDAMKPTIEGDLCKVHGKRFKILATFPEQNAPAANRYMTQNKHAAVLGTTKDGIVVLADVRDDGTQH